MLEKIKQLRQKTGCGMMATKKALEKANGDMVGAELYLRDRAFGGNRFGEYMLEKKGSLPGKRVTYPKRQ